MNIYSKYCMGILLLAFLCIQPANAETVKCSECGMKCDSTSRFTSRIVQGAETLYFCDIGDLFSYVREKNPTASRIEVRDYNTGAWVDAQKAYYVHAEKKFKSPMGWGIAAFLNKEKATLYGKPMDFNETAKALK